MSALFAYLDAGTGAILLQAIMGGFAGLVVLGRAAWRSILPRLHPRLSEKTPTAADVV
jgi:hypothetical protein